MLIHFILTYMEYTSIKRQYVAAEAQLLLKEKSLYYLMMDIMENGVMP